jgi:Glucodextranase, domain B
MTMSPSPEKSAHDLPEGHKPLVVADFPGGLTRRKLRVFRALVVACLAAPLPGETIAQSIDTIPPTIQAIVSSPANANGWHRRSVGVRWVFADTGGSGLATRPPSRLVTTEGPGQLITETVSDRAGNSASASIAISLDRTAPTVTAVRSPAAGPNGWVSSPVTVTFAATDALSGVNPVTLTPPITYSRDRNSSVTGRASDLAGNIGSFTLAGIKIDRTRPRLTVSLQPAPTGSAWRNAPVTAHFTATDAGSGIASSPEDRFFPNEGRGLTVTGTAVDNVGLSTTVTASFHIDLTPPTITTAFSRPPDVDGWYTGPVKATFVCADALSGIFSCRTPLVVASEGADLRLDAVAVDRARNTAQASETVNMDLNPPALSISAPSASAEVDSAAFTITGSATDAGSGIAGLTLNGTPVTLQQDGRFAQSIPLVEGANTFDLVALDHVGRATSRTVTITRATQPPAPFNRFSDPQFETGTSGVFAQDAITSVVRSTENPIDGRSSLRVRITRYGNNVWWTHDFNGGRASRFMAGARLRSDVNSSSSLQFCTMVYYADGSTAIECTAVSGTAGDKGQVTAEVSIDPTKRIQSVNLRMYQEGGSPVSFSVDDAVALLDVVEAPPISGGGGSGGGGGVGGGGGGSIGCPLPDLANTAYPGFSYNLPASRPFISLAPYTRADQSSTAFNRFRNSADQAVAGNPPYAYSAVSSVVLYGITGNTVYIDDAIARVEAMVSQAEAAIADGRNPAIASDSYLKIGWYLEQLALAYDHGFDRISNAQKARWAALATQSLYNLWHPSEASWGGQSRPWTGWSICDPGNNYHFHFLRATMLWALASRNMELMTFLQTEKFPWLIDYYAQLPGGGSREGTGYGTAQKDLFENYLFWKESTGEDLSALASHTRQTIDYWVHATVPTRDRFAPVGDQSRSSTPDLFDYHENLVHTAVVLNPGTAEAQRGTWWLNNNSVNGVSQAFNLLGDLLPLPDAPAIPTERVYHAAGAGVLFARSGWETTASWLSFVAGRFDQSHAHQDQGSFTFFRGDWLAVTPNIWSHSGINQETVFHNTIRFERPDGSVIPQSRNDSMQSSMTHALDNGQLTVNASLANAFSRHTEFVQQWQRRIEYVGNTLRVFDNYAVANGVRAVFQVQVPVQPVPQADGSIVAGNLRIVPLQGVTFAIHAMPAGFRQGYRIDFVSTAGASFGIELRAQ